MTLALKVTQFENDADIVHQIVHGPASGAGSTVDTDGGPVRTMAKMVDDAQGVFDDHVADTTNPHGVTKAQVGLGAADNTADADKPVSTAQQAALDLKANLASPAFTGVPTTPTAAAGTNTTQVASTAFVRAELNALVAAAPGTLDTLDELAAALGDDPNFATTMAAALGLKAPLASPTFTGDPKAPTPAVADNDTSIATTAFVKAVRDLSSLGVLGYTQLSANQTGFSTSTADVPGLSLTVTVGASRRIRVVGDLYMTSNTTNVTLLCDVREGATLLQQGSSAYIANSIRVRGEVILTPTAGVHTYKIQAFTSGGTSSVLGSGSYPSFLLIEDIGPA